MAKSRRKRSEKEQRAKAAEGSEKVDPAVHRRAAEATTVGWMLALLATLIAELLVLGGVVLVWVSPRESEAPGFLELIPGALGFTALVTGAVTLVLTPIVRRLRSDPPPFVIEVIAVAAGGIPWFLLVISLVARAVQ